MRLVVLEIRAQVHFRQRLDPRRYLKIPCDVEVGDNYKDLNKYKFYVEEEILVPLTPTELFTVPE